MVTEQMWEEYFADRTEENRNRIVEGYFHYVRYLVNDVSERIPDGLDKEDLVQSGRLGLIEAVQRFNPINGSKFETYAKLRIQGAIIDAIRYFKKNHLGISRIKSSKIRHMIEVKSALEQELKRTATSKEVAEKLEMTVQEYEKIVSDKDVKVYYEDENIMRDNFSGPGSKDQMMQTPSEEFTSQEQREMLKTMILDLNTVQQRVLDMYYKQGMNFKEIGEVMGLTESRISQINKKSVSKLQNLAGEKKQA